MSAPTSRRWLLIGALICFGLFVIWLFLPLLNDAAPAFARWGVLGTPLAFFSLDGPARIVGNAAVFLGLMLLAQWAFLRPVRRAALHDPSAGRPRWPALVAIGLVATLLCTAAVATVLEIPDWWMPVFARNDDPPWIVWMVMATVWLAWSIVFFVYFRQGDFLAKTEVVVRALFRGSCLELLVAIPTHAFVYRRSTDECYCTRGSYTGMVFGVTVLLWAFGPGLVLLFLREKQRRAPILQKLCPQCGATLDSAARPGTPCPRCGRADLR